MLSEGILPASSICTTGLYQRKRVLTLSLSLLYVVTNSLRETSLDSECWTFLNRVDVDGHWTGSFFFIVVGQIFFKCGQIFLKSVDVAGQIFLEAFLVKIELDVVVKHALEDI